MADASAPLPILKAAPPRSALVTGATRGIGRSIATRLRAHGIQVVATGRDEARLRALADETGALVVCSDLAEPGAAVALYQATCERLNGPPDFLVNNAGYNSRKALFVETSAEEFERQYRVNLAAPAELCRLALRDMTQRRSGHIVNILSTAVLHASETMGIYSAMKHGLAGLTQVLIKEARPHGVKVTAVYPGGTDSEFRAQARPDYMHPDSVAELIMNATFFAPHDAVMHELVFRPIVETNF
jgi:short-subunit dehydrogenase